MSNEEHRFNGAEWKRGALGSFEGIPVEILDVRTSSVSGAEQILVRITGLDVAPFPIEPTRLSRGCMILSARLWSTVIDELGDDHPSAEIRYALHVEQNRLLDEGDLAQVAVTYPITVKERLDRAIERARDLP